MTLGQLEVKRPRVPDDTQRTLICYALQRTQGNIYQAARLLNHDKSNLRRRCERLGIDYRAFRPSA